MTIIAISYLSVLASTIVALAVVSARIAVGILVTFASLVVGFAFVSITAVNMNVWCCGYN